MIFFSFVIMLKLLSFLWVWRLFQLLVGILWRRHFTCCGWCFNSVPSGPSHCLQPRGGLTPRTGAARFEPFNTTRPFWQTSIGFEVNKDVTVWSHHSCWWINIWVSHNQLKKPFGFSYYLWKRLVDRNRRIEHPQAKYFCWSKCDSYIRVCYFATK